MAYIYKITNQINGKIYIGKTLSSIEERWKEHCKDYKKERCKKRPLYRAMNKYGIENFTIEQVEECPSKVVNEREIYWIEQYGSFKYGYNATVGGDGKQYLDYDLVYSLYKEGKNLTEISKILKCDTHSVTKILNNFNVSHEERMKQSRNFYRKAVLMIDKETDEILKIFPSIREAGIFLNKSRCRQHIAEVCNGKRNSAYGYKWKFSLEENK